MKHCECWTCIKLKENQWRRKWLGCHESILRFALLYSGSETYIHWSWHSPASCPFCKGMEKFMYNSTKLDRSITMKVSLRRCSKKQESNSNWNTKNKKKVTCKCKKEHQVCKLDTKQKHHSIVCDAYILIKKEFAFF